MASKREAGGDLRNALRAAGDDDKLHGDEDREHDQPDDQIPADDDVTECRNQVADAAGKVTMFEDQPRGRDLKEETEKECDEERGSKRREFERFGDDDADQHDERAADDVQREQAVQNPSRHRNDDAERQRQHDHAEAVREIARFVVHAVRLILESAITISATAMNVSWGMFLPTRDVA